MQNQFLPLPFQLFFFFKRNHEKCKTNFESKGEKKNMVSRKKVTAELFSRISYSPGNWQLTSYVRQISVSLILKSVETDFINNFKLLDSSPSQS